ncbi:MAG: chemotaxis protein CheW [Pseudomonadota bacterium]
MNNQDITLSAVSLSAVLSPPDAVVQDYLDFMLRTVTETVSEAAVAKPVVVAPVAAPVITPAAIAVATSAVVEARVVKVGTAAAPVSAPLSTPVPATLSVAVEVAVDAPVATPQPTPAPLASPRAANGRPLWAQAPFECLLFQVVGLKLAAPLVELGGIARIGDGLTPIFGQSDWFMGLLRWNDRNIRVVDTARLIMPERLPALVVGERPAYEFVVLIEGTDWGLAIDSATEALHLQPDEVRWRGSMQSRPWLAGTVLEKMCALLDMGTIARLLQAEQAPASAAETDAR